jgi:hypothetical protein
LVSHHSHDDPAIHAVDLSIWDEGWGHLFKDVDVVVHFAANPGPGATWADLVAPNMDMVLNVYQASVANGVKRVVFASSNHVMSGYGGGNVPMLRSDTPPCPGNPYGATKLFGERVGKHFSEYRGISSINVRIGWNRRGDNSAPGPDADDWMRWLWLSDRDYCQLMERCINAPMPLRWTVINGMSNNTGMPWDLTEARELLGYEPEDNAFR